MLSLNLCDSRPIYEQLKERLRRLILTGGIPAGERLPSVRELAAELSINPNTIQRAYHELESEGYLFTVQGKGSFAAALTEVHDERRKKLLAQYSTIVSELLLLGVTPEELTQQINKEVPTHD